MMKQKLLLLFAVVLALLSTGNMKAETDTTWYRGLVISEISEAVNWKNNINYVEVTNMSDSTYQLADYWIQTTWNQYKNENPGFADTVRKWSFLDSTTLAPGESYLYVRKSGNGATDPFGNPLYPDGYVNPYVAQIADKVAESNSNITSYRAVGLFYRGDTSSIEGVVARDSSRIDQFWFQSDEADINGAGKEAQYPIAGVVTAVPYRDYTYARKFAFKKGNVNFDQSRGTNADNSEWIVIPNTNKADMYSKPFTTLGSHGNTSELSLTSNNPDITIDIPNKVINFPYGVRRDSVFWNFETGPNHAWEFHMGPDTTQWYISNGDTIDFIVVGDKGTLYRFGVNVAPRPSDFVKVRPLYYKNQADNWVRNYIVSDGYMDQDTVGNIRFATSVDTLMTYLVVEEGASYDFIWVDGIERPEVKDGDQLKVTAGGESKTYRLSVMDYIPNHDAQLSTVYFPGQFLWENPKTFAMTDTLIGFQNTTLSYVITLPEGSTTMPAMVAQAANNRSDVYIKRPQSLSGGEAERTAVVTVTAEDDTSTLEYKFLFNVEQKLPDVEGEVFFTDITSSWGASVGQFGSNFQIYNPTVDPVNLGNYMILFVPSGQTFQDFWANQFTPFTSAWNMPTQAAWDNRYMHIPGKLVVPGTEEGTAFLDVDAYGNSGELLGNEVYSMGSFRGWPQEYGTSIDDMRALDQEFGMNGFKDYKKWGENLTYLKERYGDDFAENEACYDKGTWLPFAAVGKGTYKAKSSNFAIVKFVGEGGDSILNGTKMLNKLDLVNDVQVVDVIGGLYSQSPWQIHDQLNGEDTVFRAANIAFEPISITRKPSVYTGNPVDHASFGSQFVEGEVGEWTVYGISANGEKAIKTRVSDEGLGGAHDFGRGAHFEKHTMLTYAHIPFINSLTYRVKSSLDVPADNKVLGVLPNTTVDAFMGEIILQDPKMVVKVTGANGVEKGGSVAIEDGDRVVSTSANAKTTVVYTISVGALNNDISLSAKDGSGLSVEGAVVKNVEFGTTLKELVANLDVNALSMLEITDGEDYIIPMEMYSRDTILAQAATKTDVLVNDMYKVEVTAQDGTVGKYSIEFAAKDEVYVLSNIYKVYEEYKNIDFVEQTYVGKFLSNLIASPGATMYIINKFEQKREIGRIGYDDRLVVEKGDVRKIYMLKFNNDDRWTVSVDDAVADVAGAYPNPTAGLIHVADLKGATQIQVRNLAGQLIQSRNVNSNVMTIDLNGPNGIYFVTVLSQNEKLRTEKVIKE